MVEQSPYASKSQHLVRRFLSHYFTPYLLVVSSESAANKLEKLTSLSPAEILRPFGRIPDGTKMRQYDDKPPVYLKNQRINFFDSQ